MPERLKVLSDAFGRAQRMRCAICIFIIHMSKSMICEQPIYRYVSDMLASSQLIGFYLIYYILVCDTAHPIMRDSYLTMDTMKFIEAYDVWNQYPKCYRKYMGLMADKDTLALMGGHCLRRLTYIAIQIASRRDPSLKNLKFVVPPDSDKLDLLIKKYFPDETTNLNTINLEKMITPLVTSINVKRYLDEVVNMTNSAIIRTAFEDAFGREKDDQKHLKTKREPMVEGTSSANGDERNSEHHSRRTKIDLEKFGNFEKVLRLTAYCNRFVSNCKTLPERRRLRELTSEEMITAEKYWLKIVQRNEFHDEIQKLQNGRPLPKENRLKTLDPFLDEDGLLRVGGRLRFSDLDYEMNNTLHAGNSQTLTTLRQNFWILNGRAAVKRVLRNCVICKKQEARPFEQKMADLPKMRTSETFPFENTGLDFIGPLHIYREDGCTKVYICLFTCMVTRSIHLELLSDLSAERFIQALNRFGSRRGYPRIIQSDNFSTFKMAYRQLKNLFSKPTLDKVQRTMIRHRTEWKFITERAPWNGGYWERLVRSVKNTLKKILGRKTLDEEELTTVLCEIEAKINARPLTFVGDDVKNADALTPFHFLIGRSFVDLPMMSTPTVDEEELPLNRKWWKRQQIILHFWKRWRNEYVTTFVSRSKWMTKRQEPKEGDIVLVKEDNAKRESWSIGRITSVLPGSDGLCRTVEVKTAKGTFTRPVARLYLLEPASTR
ncbi:hypothetical protein T02_12727 [Trichinella nativa]|uniref:Integrase catalytic domain-containing protein n=1 Tax=Trichinella nativa TaxID=6335 RepID=A0A0V1KVB2_9BILA|nr:hypothetical protein T02_12727 [Trichinella nativa]